MKNLYIETYDVHMKQDKMHLVNEIFNNETIRTILRKEQEKFFICVSDIVSVASGCNNSQTYLKET